MSAANFDTVEKKIREAAFFLQRLKQLEDLAFGDPERFDFNLGAFLGAARVIDYRLCHEHSPEYPIWRTWNEKNPQHQSFLKFMALDRAAEVHKSGSERSVDIVEKPVHGSYSDASGTLESIGSFLLGPTAAAINIRRYFYDDIDGAKRPVTDARGAYLQLLTSLTAAFRDRSE
jgi:hypothetical protein